MNNNSLQGDLQEAIRNALNCANSFEGDLYALCNLYGVADGAVSGRLIPVAQKHSPTIGTASGALNYLLQNPTVLPSLGLNFVDGTDRLDSRVTFTRASNAWRFNSAGVLTQATTNTPRFDYNPATLAPRGLLIEEQRTNSIRNNTMVGAVAGTPGTLPTNWQVNVGGMSYSVIGTGAENGISYIDVRIFGTTTQTFNNIRFETNTTISAANLQTWSSSFFVRRIAGSTTNINAVENRLYFRDSGGGTLQEVAVSVNSILGSSTVQRTSQAVTAASASIAYVNNAVNLDTASGVAVDITLRIGLPQLEQGAFATSPILTSGAAATRAADVAVMTGTNFSSWYNQSEGTLFAEGSSPTTARVLVAVDDGTMNNRYQLTLASSYTPNFAAVSGGAVSADVYTAPLTAGTTVKVAGAYRVNDFALSANGSSIAADTSGALPISVSVLRLGVWQTGGGYLNGYIRRIAYYPRRLSNSELQAITS